jgi:hypothetical protein
MMHHQVARTARSRFRTVEWAAWSPAQVVAGIVGVIYVVIGGIAWARAGTDFSDIPATHAAVVGLQFTCLSAVVQLAAGVIVLAGAVSPVAAKSVSAVFGVASVVWGIIVAADVTRFATTWGYTTGTAVFYIVVGAILLLAGVASPVVFSRERDVTAGGSGDYM